MDLSMKHEKLPKALREKQTPFEHYLLVRQGWQWTPNTAACADRQRLQRSHTAAARHSAHSRSPADSSPRPSLPSLPQPMLQLVKAEKSERHELGTGTPYQRTIP